MAIQSGLTSPWMRALGILVLVQIAQAGLAITYCSPDLTATNFEAVFNLYQTNSACHDACQGSFAYAVLQGQNCWCSNYAPADQVSTYSCNTVCPGYPSEWCGNTQEGLYGYFQLSGVAPSGTAGASSSSPSPSSTSKYSVSNPPSGRTGFSNTASLAFPFSTGGSFSLTENPTVQSSIRTSSGTPVGSTPSTAAVIVSDSVSSSTTSSPSKTITTTAAPSEIYTSIMTVTGQVKTILVTPTPSTDSTLGSGTVVHSSGGGISTGKVVGIVLGVALGLGLLVGLGVFFCVRKKHRRNAEAAAYENASSQGNNGIPSRQVSQMSSAGLLNKIPRIQTSGFPSNSNPKSADTLGSNFDRRSVGTDQRLNPYAIYAHDESRHSNVSLQDNQDYSRQLRVANPDP